MAKKKPKKATKKHKKPAKRTKQKTPAQEIRQENRTMARGGKTIRIYGHEVEKNKVINAAIEAYNKKRYTTNEIQAQDYISNPQFHNLMIKIAILDRIEEELIRLYPDAEIERLNSVTITIR